MKNFFRFIAIAALLVFLVGGAYLIYINYVKTNKTTDTLSLIPPDAVLIVETNDLPLAWNRFTASDIWNHLRKNKDIAEIDSMMTMINNFMQKPIVKQLITGGLGDRKLLMSLHMTSATDFDFVFVIDMKKTPDITMLGNALSLTGFRVEESKFKGANLMSLIDKQTSEAFYLSQVENLLVISFNKRLIEDALLNRETEYWKNSTQFASISNKVRNQKLANIYLQYNLLPRFVRSFVTDQDDLLNAMAASLDMSGFDIDIEGRRLALDGITLADSVPSYISALIGVKPGKTNAASILPTQTALYLSLGFENFNDFYTNLIQQYKSDDSATYQSIEANVSKIEKLLSINMQENFFDWIGTEVAFAKLRPEAGSRVEDVVVAIHARNIDQAKEGFGRIIKQIDRRTPIEFDAFDYRNFPINYMNMGGMFKLFFGKLFDKLEKPYYTYIDNYLVLSNSIEALKTVIDFYVEGQTLDHDPKFMEFYDNFSPKSNAKVFVQMPKIYTNLHQYSTAETRKSLAENKELILSFNFIGLEFTSGDNVLYSRLLADHDPDALISDELELIENNATSELLADVIETGVYGQIPRAAGIIQDDKYFEWYDAEQMKLRVEAHMTDTLPDGIARFYYPSGKLQGILFFEDGKLNGKMEFFHDDELQTKRAEATLEDGMLIDTYKEFHPNGARSAVIEYKKGLKHGDAEFYYPSGNLHIKGEFKKGSKEGKWKIYDENGEVINKEKYKKGKQK